MKIREKESKYELIKFPPIIKLINYYVKSIKF
jgi:hypothetical protein